MVQLSHEPEDEEGRWESADFRKEEKYLAERHRMRQILLGEEKRLRVALMRRSLKAGELSGEQMRRMELLGLATLKEIEMVLKSRDHY